MTINYIPNDPRAGSPAMRSKKPRSNRPSDKSGFNYTGQLPKARYEPGTPGFVFWQCREGALYALSAFEKSAGAHRSWQGGRRKLSLLQDDGEDLNAYYDRSSFAFFHQKVGNATFFSGQSTDVVAHEVGHGLLDSIRPELWDVAFLEVGAFHEAFGDCMAILTALRDKETRELVLAAAPDLRKRNFVESTAEDLSEGIRRLVPNHNAAEPRHAFNKHQFQIPDTLPPNAGPGKLIDEVHSFGMIFTGCFWDLIANFYEASETKSEANLRRAARKAGRLMIEGARTAVIAPRFIQAVGRAMVLADDKFYGGADRDHIRNAFAAHNVMLGANALLAPTTSLEGRAPAGKSLPPAVKKEIMRRLQTRRGAKLEVSEARFSGHRMVRAVHTRKVELGDVSRALKGVVAFGTEPVLVGASGRRAAVFGALPNPENTEKEVKAFVKSLLDHNRIDFGRRAGAAAKTRRSSTNREDRYTHVIETVRGEKQLRRKRFRCYDCR